MLRITILNETNASTIKLDGKIAGPWVAELSRTWQSLADSLGSRTLRLDLRGVTYIDAAGQQLLRDIYCVNRAEFLSNSPLVAYFVAQATAECSQLATKGD